ncbi:hypothetical protein [Alkalicoccobacillus plakortidis]|uniref:Xylose isomerase-like TIM barrel protein n=1 Tax=Alkalicoccobacillus plakortidis TaxID=444060 RepID=A0ABT0XK19_9BACI|nr:hypothetical protein [Alkalicoccobacillus plakortidis]MCM2676246.1 hypothetical protein [Alkalicoccobacillus plakortidis]
MRYLSLTSWSLNRILGPLHWTKWDQHKKEIVTSVIEQPEIHSLLDLPFLLAKKGYQAMEIIHPHFPSTDTEYLKELRKATEKAGIRFYNLLIDYGDITNEDPIRRKHDMEFIKAGLILRLRLEPSMSVSSVEMHNQIIRRPYSLPLFS